MEACVGIAELRLLITQCVEDNRTLSRLARVNKSFRDPALNALYASIDSLLTLVKTLPPDLWELREDGSKRDPRCYSIWFTRRMSSRDWDVLFSYASRVQSVKEQFPRGSGEPGVILSSGVYDSLSRCPFPYLFPNLRALDVRTAGSESYTWLVGIFLSPSLRKLRLYTSAAHDADDETLLEYAPRIAVMCPLMEEIDVLAFLRHETLSLARSETDCAWKHLRSVNWGPVDDSMLAHMSVLERFNSLTVRVHSKSRWLTSDTRFSLRELTYLALKTDSGKTAVRALERLLGSTPPSSPPSTSNQPTKLSRLICTTVELKAVSKLTSSLTCLRPDKESILLVWLSDGDLFGSDLTGKHSADWLDGINALSTFQNLRILRVWYSKQHLKVSAKQLCDLVANWPRLKCLSFGKLENPLSFVSLVEIIQIIPRAFEVVVPTMITPLDTTGAVFVKDPEMVVPVFRRIKKLCLHYQHEGDKPNLQTAESVANLLCYVVPGLASVQPVEEKYEHKKYWESVVQAMSVELERVRAEEES